MTIITPHRHSTHVPISCNVPISCGVPIPECGNLRYYLQQNRHLFQKLQEVFDTLPDDKHVFFVGFMRAIISHIYNFATRQWNNVIREYHEYNNSSTLCDDIRRAIIELTNFAWEYDRECENAKNLQIIGEFFRNAMDRADLMDVFTEVVQQRKQKQNVSESMELVHTK
jgi:hypothetical protein